MIVRKFCQQGPDRETKIHSPSKDKGLQQLRFYDHDSTDNEFYF